MRFHSVLVLAVVGLGVGVALAGDPPAGRGPSLPPSYDLKVGWADLTPEAKARLTRDGYTGLDLTLRVANPMIRPIAYTNPAYLPFAAVPPVGQAAFVPVPQYGLPPVAAFASVPAVQSVPAFAPAVQFGVVGPLGGGVRVQVGGGCHGGVCRQPR